MVQALLLERTAEPFREANVTLDDPGPFEVLVDVKASGLCHSDITAATYEDDIPKPAILGHEVSGIVRSVGPAVTACEPGDHVVACLQVFCGKCAQCQAGHPILCPNRNYVAREAGARPRITLDGQPVFQMMDIAGFAEQVLLHEGSLVRLETHIPHDIASVLGCGVLTGAGAVLNTTRTGVNTSVAVFGCGGLGLSAIGAARIAGAPRIIAVDIAEDKLAVARDFGATDTVNSLATDPVEAIRALTTGVGADEVFDFVGRVETTAQAYEAVARGGQLTIVGIPRPDASILPLDVGREFLFQQRRINPVLGGGGNFRRDIPRYADLYRQGRFAGLDSLVQRTISLSEVNEAYATMAGTVGRAVITFD